MILIQGHPGPNAAHTDDKMTEMRGRVDTEYAEICLFATSTRDSRNMADC